MVATNVTWVRFEPTSCDWGPSQKQCLYFLGRAADCLYSNFEEKERTLFAC